MSVCPVCGKEYKTVKRFVRHVATHQTKGGESTGATRVEAILLGVASSVVWEFMRWVVSQVPAEKIVGVVEHLLGLHFQGPFYCGSSVMEVLWDPRANDDAWRDRVLEDMEDGLLACSEHDRIMLERLFGVWIEEGAKGRA